MSSVFPPSCAARFRHVAELARGGYGTVHRAVQIALERRVVVKLLHASTNEPEQLARFASEARVTASLADPHIVVVIDHDVSGGIPWIAYEELPGPDVRALIDAGVPPLAEATRIVSHVASALAAAHALRVLHRDIKPENVLVQNEDVVKLVDFGIARDVNASRMTVDGEFLGTVAFMAPEQMAGGAVDPRTDIYALGVTLWCMLTGGLPFKEGTLMKKRANIKQFPSQILRGCPREVDALLERCLADNPDDRFQGCYELARALEPIAAYVEANVA